MLTAEQIRAARALIRMEQTELAAKSGVSLGTIRRLEGLNGSLNAQEGTLQNIRVALEQAGVEFIEEDEAAPMGGAGVRLVRNQASVEWNRQVEEVFIQAKKRLSYWHLDEVVDDFIKPITGVKAIAFDDFEAALAMIFDHAKDDLTKDIADVNADDLFSWPKPPENQ
ncbi:helix-turn-helix domain-containing protein [Pararhizobium sp. LjRoot238]|uniref:helix-turn-helix domain-containing protein n=1 Tax=Pararhizobium sp. LjRoot238 TaxID=3342293 RepID=UPI003ECCCB55